MTNVATAIIARLTAANEPIVFLTDTIDYANDTLEVFTGADLSKKEKVAMAVYRSSSQVSEADEKFIAETLMKTNPSITAVDIRHKLPRRHQKALPSILTGNKPEATPTPAPAPVPAGKEKASGMSVAAIRAEIVKIGNEFDEKLQKLLAMLPA